MTRKCAAMMGVCALLGVSACDEESGGGSGSGPPRIKVVTVELRAEGVVPDSIVVDPGGHVRFYNLDEIPHEITADDDEECSELNVPKVEPRAGVTTIMEEREKTCAYHDKLNPDDDNMRGTVLVKGPAPASN